MSEVCKIIEKYSPTKEEAVEYINDALKQNMTISHDGQDYHEFNVRVAGYPERGKLQRVRELQKS